MTDTAPTVECPGTHGFYPGDVCWLCGCRLRAGRTNPELAAAFRIGGNPALWAMIDAHPEAYPAEYARYTAPVKARPRARPVKGRND